MGEAPDELRTEQIESTIEGTRSNLSADLDELSERLSPSNVAHRQVDKAKSRVSGVAGSVRDRVMGSASDVAGTVRDKAGSVHDSAVSAKEGASGSAGGAASGVAAKTRGNPLAAGLVAFGAGMLVSALFPASQKEAEVTGAAVERAKSSSALEEVKGVAADVGGSLQDSAKEAAQSVGQTAKDAAQNVKSDAQDATVDVKEHGQSAAGQVRESARG